MAQPVPILLTSFPGLGVDTSLSKSHDSTYFVQNTAGGGGVAVSQPQQPLLVPYLQATAICPSGGFVTLTNPPTGPGLYAILCDFGATAGGNNVSCISNFGPAGNLAPNPPNRWIGGAEISSQVFIAGVAVEAVQIAPNPVDGTTLRISNYSDVNLPAGVITMVQLGSYMGF